MELGGSMLKRVFLVILVGFLAAPAWTAPAVESYSTALAALSFANDERAHSCEATRVNSTALSGVDGAQVVEFHVICFEPTETGALHAYARDVYLVTVRAYAKLVSIQFIERALFERESGTANSGVDANVHP